MEHPHVHDAVEGHVEQRRRGERSTQIIQRLGDATLTLFNAQNELAGSEVDAPVNDPGVGCGTDGAGSAAAGGEVDEEFMSWFGLKSQNLQLSGSNQGQPTPSVDLPWNDLFEDGFEFGGSWGLMW